MSLTAKQINNLKSLLQGESLAWSALNAEIRKTLIEEELIVIKSQRSRKTLYTPSPDGLRVFLEQHFEELRSFDWNKEELPFSETRADLATMSGNSKTKEIRSCPGFMVNSYTPIPAQIGNNKLTISPEEGTMLFIADWERFFIPDDVLVIGIENMENFRHVRKQKHLFPNKSILFVSRYPQSKDLIKWLIRIPNQYLHFGDFDLAGMHIFESEFYKHIQERASFFEPDDIESRIQKGSVERYNEQYNKFRNYNPLDKRLQPLYNLIQKYHRCYDQEGYINNY
ncbi:MAG: hypothetical protein IK131_07195 [Paludibacteraceae bacterium]|nr:hypothetical protein [Paludibacteraceae bacterium]